MAAQGRAAAEASGDARIEPRRDGGFEPRRLRAHRVDQRRQLEVLLVDPLAREDAVERIELGARLGAQLIP
jgi:hypothetical protein